MAPKRKAVVGSNPALADDADTQLRKRRKVEVCRTVIEGCRVQMRKPVDVVGWRKFNRSGSIYVSLIARLEPTHGLGQLATSLFHCITALLHPALHSSENSTTICNTSAVTNMHLLQERRYSERRYPRDPRNHDRNWIAISRGAQSCSRQAVSF